MTRKIILILGSVILILITIGLYFLNENSELNIGFLVGFSFGASISLPTLLLRKREKERI